MEVELHIIMDILLVMVLQQPIMVTLLVLVIATPVMDEVVSGSYKYAFVLVSLVYITIRVRRLIVKLKE